MVLREGNRANTNEEFLCEACIIATVDNHNLLQQMEVCMTSNLILETHMITLGSQLNSVHNNREKIISKYQLNWCTQIATGTDYFKKTRLVHHGFAAINILVQTPTCVKICLKKLLDINEEKCESFTLECIALYGAQHHHDRNIRERTTITSTQLYYFGGL